MQVHSPDSNAAFPLATFWSMPITRFNMHEHIPHSWNLGADFVLHFVRDFMRMLDGHLRVYFNMHVRVELITHFPNESFFDALDAIDGFGEMPDLLAQFATGASVH